MADWRSLTPQVVVAVVLVATNVALIGAMGTSTTPYGPYNGQWDGTSDLRSLSAQADSDPTLVLDTRAYEAVPADNTTSFVVAPQSTYSTSERARLRQFVSRGGTLVVAAESNETNALLAALGIEARIDGRPLLDKQSNVRNASLPVATNVSAHPLTDGVGGLSLNHGATVDPGNATVLVESATTAFVDRNRNGTLDLNEAVDTWPVATVESRGEGRVVVVSDASVFTNAMLGRAGNRAFASNLVAGTNTTLFDRSNAGPVPPLPYTLTVLRTTPSVQFAVATVAFGLLAVVASGFPSSFWRRTRRFVGRSHSDTLPVTLSEQEISAYLTDQHPDWDDRRIERVAKAIRRRRGDGEDDD